MPENTYLPLGSVIMLEGGDHRVMITGYGHTLNGQEHIVYDYVGCLWPEGTLGSDQTLAFNRSQVNEVYFLGYQTEGQQVFIARIEAALAEYRASQEEK